MKFSARASKNKTMWFNTVPHVAAGSGYTHETSNSVYLFFSILYERANLWESDSPRVLLERRLRWLVEVLCGNSVFCWWLLSMGLVAMMSLHLFIRASLVLSLTVEKVEYN